MVLGSQSANILWKLLRNGLGLISESFGIDLGSFFIVQVTIFSISLTINSPNEKMSLFNFKSHHLVINPVPGLALKCAPGHDSIKDSSIIKSYWLKVGLVHSENFKLWLWVGQGSILFSCNLSGLRTRIKLSWDFLFSYIRNPWFHGQERLGTLRVRFGIAPE